MAEAFSITAAELVSLGKNAIPPQLRSTEHLVYSSPATLAFNSPGAQGFGVKRAGLAVPESVMLLVAPACCGRNTSALGAESSLADRFFYLLQDEADIVTGRHLTQIPQAVQEVVASCQKRPSAVMLCITCVDALLGTDVEAVCRKASEAAGLPVVPCYMYALTREGRLPPMVSVRKSIYSLLKPTPRRKDAVNLLGYFSPLQEDCELPALLRSVGLQTVKELSRCADFAEFQEMSRANFNLVLHPEVRVAADDLHQRLGIPSIELTRVYDLEKVRHQYEALANAIGVTFKFATYYSRARDAVEAFHAACPEAVFAVGEWCNADPFELTLSLLRYGFRVSDLYGTVSTASFVYLRKIAELSPNTRIFSNLSPTMLVYHGSPDATHAIGNDAAFYNPNRPAVSWADEPQPFGFAAIEHLFRNLLALL
ncbi:MAG: hypothetical protein IJJ26_00310 [Victivallales bacterium]|nr:hypothetical protein [Victivallales bacterium]